MGELIVTGASGFVGSFLAEAAARDDSCADSQFVGLPDTIDIRDAASLKSFLKGRRIAKVVHLAGQSFVPESFRDPRSTLEINLLGTLNLLEALAAVGFEGSFLYVGTADAYGASGAESLPITEDHPLRPGNPYAVSKVAAEALCFQWSLTSSMRIVLARPFNHIGPGQSARFFVSHVAKQIAEIRHGLRAPVLRVGNIDVTRDFIDVRDVVRAYVALLEAGRSGEAYNVCSGREASMRETINQMLDLAGVSARIETDPALVRPTDSPRFCGSCEKLHMLTGWSPRIPFRQSLQETIEFWARTVKNG
jgi:GDP-4-dehydro-6-deoxy-D-mannose reductase